MAEVGNEAGAELVCGPSLKAVLDRDWDQVEQRGEALEMVLQVLQAVEVWGQTQKPRGDVLNAYVGYFNRARPHQGIGQQIPEPSRSISCSQDAGSTVIACPVVGGLHHDYRWAGSRRTACLRGQLED